MTAAQRTFIALLAALCLVLAGCAGTPTPLETRPGDDVPASRTTANPLAIHDPLARFNRSMYHFNAWLDEYLLLPIVNVYKTVLPQFMRQGVANFLSNIGEITTFINTVLQLEPKDASVTLLRFLINSTIGLGGLLDPATALGLEQRHEDFGQTLAVYGVAPGPYLVLPFFGPSTLRDSLGLAVDRFAFYTLNPLPLSRYKWTRAAYLALYAINKRYKVNFRYYQTGSPFEYVLVRLIYMNYRALQVAR